MEGSDTDIHKTTDLFSKINFTCSLIINDFLHMNDYKHNIGDQGYGRVKKNDKRLVSMTKEASSTR